MLFLAPLCNASGYLTMVDLGAPFRIEKWPRRRLLGTLKKLELLPNSEILVRVESTNCLLQGKRFAYVVVAEVAIPSVDTLPMDRFMEAVHEQDRYCDALEEKLRLMRLFKMGHIDAFAMYWYTENGKKIDMAAARGPGKIPHDEPYYIRRDEAPAVTAFLASWKLPLKMSFLQLALESFEESFNAERIHIRFLNLMIALEALFNVGKDELKFRISRNAAVLLGEDRDMVDDIFHAMRKFYDKRSQLVHTGKFDQILAFDVIGLASFVREAIKALAASGLQKDEIDRQLTRMGFGESAKKRELVPVRKVARTR